MGAIINGGYDVHDISVSALPIYHCAQHDVFMDPILWVGGTNILNLPDIGRILKSIADYRTMMFLAPPTGKILKRDLRKAYENLFVEG